MSWTNLSNKKVKIKKDRICHGCQCKYITGNQMHKNVGIHEGDFSSTYWCEICEEFMTDRWGDYDEGLGEGEIWQDMDYSTFREQKMKEGVPGGILPKWKIREDENNR